MATLAFDSLRFARRLREAGVPEPQAEAQAELMAEAFGFYADNIVTRDYLDAVLRAGFGEQEQRFEQITGRFRRVDGKFEQMERRFEQIDRRFEQIDDRFEQMERRFEQVDARFEQIEGRFEQLDKRFEQIDKRLDKLDVRLEKLEPLRVQATLHSFMLGLIVLVLVAPQLQLWLSP